MLCMCLKKLKIYLLLFSCENRVVFLLQILPTIYCAQEFGTVPNNGYSSIYYKGVSGNGSPPWRPDDKDGHYAFAVGENLTPRCKSLNV